MSETSQRTGIGGALWSLPQRWESGMPIWSHNTFQTHSRLLTSAKRVHRRHAAKTIKHLVMRQRSTIATTKHLFK